MCQVKLDRRIFAVVVLYHIMSLLLLLQTKYHTYFCVETNVETSRATHHRDKTILSNGTRARLRTILSMDQNRSQWGLVVFEEWCIDGYCFS